MEEAINRLKSLLSWSDRIGSDEIYEIREIISILKSNQTYTRSEMEKAFIAGGKANRNIENPGFDEFINNLKK